MAPGRGDLQNPLCGLLSLHITETQARASRDTSGWVRRGGKPLPAEQMRHHRGQVRSAEDFDARRQGGLARPGHRHDDLAAARIPQRERQSQHAPDGAQTAVQRQLTDEAPLAQRFGVQHALRRENAESDGKIETRPALAQVRRSQVHGHPSIGKRLPEGGNRTTHPRGALTHRGLGEPHDVDPRQQRADPYLDLDYRAVDSDQRRSVRAIQGCVLLGTVGEGCERPLDWGDPGPSKGVNDRALPAKLRTGSLSGRRKSAPVLYTATSRRCGSVRRERPLGLLEPCRASLGLVEPG